MNSIVIFLQTLNHKFIHILLKNIYNYINYVCIVINFINAY